MSVPIGGTAGAAAVAIVGDDVVGAGRQPRPVHAVAEAHVGPLLVILAGHEHPRVGGCP